MGSGVLGRRNLGEVRRRAGETGKRGGGGGKGGDGGRGGGGGRGSGR